MEMFPSLKYILEEEYSKNNFEKCIEILQEFE
jgi:hypothetical protein